MSQPSARKRKSQADMDTEPIAKRRKQDVSLLKLGVADILKASAARNDQFHPAAIPQAS